MKLTDSKIKKIMKSARGEKCTLRIYGVCNKDSETTVWCHFPEETKGMGKKGFVLSGGYGCNSCRDVIDNRVKPPDIQTNIMPGGAAWLLLKEEYMRRAQTRTLKRLLEKGILKI